MRLGICSVCLPDLTPEEAVVAVRDAGYAGIEWRVVANPDVGDGPPSFFTNNRCTFTATPGDIARAVRITEAAGLRVIGLDTYLDTGDTRGADEAFELAAGAEVDWIRVRAPWRNGRPYRELFAEAVAFFDGLSDRCAQTGVRALLELHQRSICPSASLAHRLVGEFDPARIGVIYDVGNLAIEGYEDHALAAELLGEHLAHVHLKNVTFGAPGAGGLRVPEWSALDDGVVDVPGLLTALAGHGYQGWISVEDFSTARPPGEAARFNAHLLSGLLPAAARP